jgi:xylulokinase
MTFTGIDGTATPERLIRAGREALGYELSFLLSKIGEFRPVPDVLDVSGGLCNDRILMGIISSITGRKLRLHRDVDASYGDALLAAAASGFLPPEELKAMGGGTMVFPDRTLHEKFLPWNRRFRDLAENGGVTRP